MAKLHRADGKHNRGLRAEVERHLENARRALARAVETQLHQDASFAERERVMLELNNEMGRRCLEEELQRTAERYDDKYLRIDTVLHRRHSVGTVTYHTLCGPVTVRRWVYRRQLKRNDDTAVPLELSAGLVERATPAMAYRVALGYAQGPSRHLTEQLEAAVRRPPSRSTLERMAKRIGTAAKEQAPHIEPFVRDLEQLPNGTHAISLGLDRTTVPMEELLPESVAERRSARRSRPYIRSRPRPVEVNYRMAYVGTVSFVDQDRRSLKTLRYVASAETGPAQVLKSMVADVLHANAARNKSRHPPLAVGVVQDGAPEMWTLVGEALREAGLDKGCHQTLDWYHLIERLADMLSMLPMQKVTRQATLERWKKQLQHDDEAAKKILRYARRKLGSYLQDCQTCLKRPNIEHAKLLRAHAVYLHNNCHRMNYASALAAGLPIGSGATEGACRSTISARAKGSGQRWKPPGVDAALTLRAHLVSMRLPHVWQALSHQYRAALRPAA